MDTGKRNTDNAEPGPRGQVHHISSYRGSNTNPGQIGLTGAGAPNPGPLYGNSGHWNTNPGQIGLTGAGAPNPGPLYGNSGHGNTNPGQIGLTEAGAPNPGTLFGNSGHWNTNPGQIGLTGAGAPNPGPLYGNSGHGNTNPGQIGLTEAGAPNPGPLYGNSGHWNTNPGQIGLTGAGAPNPGPEYGNSGHWNTNAGQIGLTGAGAPNPGPEYGNSGHWNTNPGQIGLTGAGAPNPGPEYGNSGHWNTNSGQIGLTGASTPNPGTKYGNYGHGNTNAGHKRLEEAGTPNAGALNLGFGNINAREATAYAVGLPVTGKIDVVSENSNKRGLGASESDSASYTDTEFEKQFKEIKKLLECAKSKQILNEVQEEDITIFIGNTKSGKSTLINYVIGNQMTAVKMDDFPFSMTVVKANEKERGPVISLEPVSETASPSIWSASRSGLKGKVVDAPGFDDNRGEAQDIANTFYIKEIIRNAKSVKFVLNTDLNDIISQNINNFTNFIDKIHRIFPETRVLHGGIALVFSKGGSALSSRDICNFFKKNILDQQEMHVKKSLIQYFVDHEECIAFFEMPSSEGAINRASIADDGIMDVVGNKIIGIPGKSLTNVQSGVSDKSKVFLLQSQAELCNQGQYFDLLQSVKDAFSNIIMKIYKYESTDEVNQMDEYLQSLYDSVYKLVPLTGGNMRLVDIVAKLSALCNVCGCQNLMDDSNIAIQVQFVEFLDEILRLNNCRIYIAKFQSTLETIKKDISEARILAATKLKKITKEDAEKRRREMQEKHNVEMAQLLKVIETQTLANRRSVEDQLKNLGIMDMIVMTTKKIVNKFFPGL